MNIAKKMHLEELNLNAWPALKILYLDGWQIRYSAGLTRRANCIIPFQSGSRDLIQKIKICRKIYKSYDLQTYFKISPICKPDDLDLILKDQGFLLEATTQVMESKIPVQNFDLEFIVFDSNQELWLRALCSMRNWNDFQGNAFMNLKNRIFCRTNLISFQKNNKIYGLALGVIQEEHLVILHLIVDSKYHKNGIGTSLVHGLCAWAQKHRIANTIISVEKNNASALSFYKSLGFENRYEYHFRKL